MNYKKFSFNYIFVSFLIFASLLSPEISFANTEGQLTQESQSSGFLTIEDEAEDTALSSAEDLEKRMIEHTSLDFNSIKDVIKKGHIKHGVIYKNDGTHYMWVESKDGKEFVFKIHNKNVTKVNNYNEIPYIAHFALKRRISDKLEDKIDRKNINQEWKNRIETKYLSNQTSPKSDIQIRDAYNKALITMADEISSLIPKSGINIINAETVRMYSDIRRELGKILKKKSNFLITNFIYARNLISYHDKYGPTYSYKKKREGKSNYDILASSVKSGGENFNWIPEWVHPKVENNKKHSTIIKLIEKLKQSEKYSKSSKISLTKQPNERSTHKRIVSIEQVNPKNSYTQGNSTKAYTYAQKASPKETAINKKIESQLEHRNVHVKKSILTQKLNSIIESTKSNFSKMLTFFSSRNNTNMQTPYLEQN